MPSVRKGGETQGRLCALPTRWPGDPRPPVRGIAHERAPGKSTGARLAPAATSPSAGPDLVKPSLSPDTADACFGGLAAGGNWEQKVRGDGCAWWQHLEPLSGPQASPETETRVSQGLLPSVVVFPVPVAAEGGRALPIPEDPALQITRRQGRWSRGHQRLWLPCPPSGFL